MLTCNIKKNQALILALPWNCWVGSKQRRHYSNSSIKPKKVVTLSVDKKKGLALDI